LNLAAAGVDPTAWHHLAVTFRADLNALNLWLDGKHSSYVIVPGHSSVGNALPLEIGRNGPLTGKYWLGKIDDVRIWDVARTGTAVTATFQMGARSASAASGGTTTNTDTPGSASTPQPPSTSATQTASRSSANVCFEPRTPLTPNVLFARRQSHRRCSDQHGSTNLRRSRQHSNYRTDRPHQG